MKIRIPMSANMRFFLLAAMAAPLVLWLATLAGCATPPAVVHDTPNGVVVEHPGVECPDAAERFGCTQKVGGQWHTYYPAGYENVRGHEGDHTQGMVHGAWACADRECCAQITAAGRTRWTVGHWMCTQRSWDTPMLLDAPYYELKRPKYLQVRAY